MELLLVLLAGVGLSHVLVDGSIIETWRKQWQEKATTNSLSAFLAKITSCYQCSGVWSGLFCGILYFVSLLPLLGWLQVFLYAFAVSYLSMLGSVILMYLNTGTDS